MGQGINMLVSSLERFLKDLFIFLASNINSIERQIRINEDPKSKIKGPIESLIEKNRGTFNF
ncbi:hypothetical protein MYX76_05825 [Desulfobacterota bacterium AH_259_B03_O07]|nr:hypothetical protein [Desulfobacterota bacterium AH_259_B03_O07]